MKRLLGVSVLLGSWLVAQACWAANFVNSTDAHRPVRSASLEEPPPDDQPPLQHRDAPRPDRNDSFTLLVSPLYVIFPMLKVAGEYRATPHSGLALSAGYGQSTLDVPEADGSTGQLKAGTYLFGVQVIGYPLRKFDGFELGAQFQYVHVDVAGKLANSSIGGVADGASIGPFIGYKWITPVGFTALIQTGFQYVAVQADASDPAGSSASASDSRLIPLLNLDLGWSF